MKHVPIIINERYRFANGVYCITNTMTGKRYIGSAARGFARRWREHRSSLNRGCHKSPHLQSAWNKYGPDAFVFDVLLVCAPADCVMYEQRCIDRFRVADKKHGYNMAPKAGSNLGQKRTAEQRERIGASRRGKKASPESVAARKAAYARPEVKAKMRASHLGKKQSAESIRKRVATMAIRLKANGGSPMKGRKPTPEALAARKAAFARPEVRAKMSAARRRPETLAKNAATRLAKRLALSGQRTMEFLL